ncbi:MAG: hypothetical protein ACXWX6_04950, partial [Actinomycetota bacterium]
MDGETDRERISFLGRCLPPAFELRVVAVGAGRERAFRAAEWRDAIVVVERGEIDVECPGGVRLRFRRGDILCLTGVRLLALRNPGGIPALLAAVSRRPPG